MFGIEHQEQNTNIIDVQDTANGVVPFEEDNYAMVPQNQMQKPEDDEEDKAISKKIDDVYDKASDAFEELTAYTQIIEPRYAARNAEVAAQYLKIALDAANSRAKVKIDKTKNASYVPWNNNNSGTQNIVVADRNDILKMMKNKE